MDINKELLQEARKCVKCGSCLSVCPVYKELCEESYSPRGRAALAEELGQERQDLTSKLIEIFTKCIGCASCEAVCTKDVPITKIVYEIRELLYEKKHFDIALHTVAKLMYKSPYIFTLILKNAALLEPLLFEEIKGLDLLKPRRSLPFLSKSRFLPKVKSKFFLDHDFGEPTTSKRHISLFTGCVFNFIQPSIAHDSLSILKRIGKDVNVCSEQMCCCLPALGIGDMHGLKKVVMKNIQVLDGARPEKIVVLCSSCSLMLKKYYPMIFEDESSRVREKVMKFADKVVDYAAYLREHPDELDSTYKLQEKQTVTYHTPCHLSKGLNKSDVIKDIFTGKRNLEIVELEEPEACCGFGGIFNYKFSELSLKILDRKVNDIIGSDAKTVLTSCSGCIMQIREGLLRRDTDVEVLHISEFIMRNKR